MLCYFVLCRKGVFPKNVKKRKSGKWSEGSAITKPVLVNFQFLYIHTVWYFLFIWPSSSKILLCLVCRRGRTQLMSKYLIHCFPIIIYSVRGATEVVLKPRETEEKISSYFRGLIGDTSDLMHHHMCHFSCLTTAPAATGSVTIPARLSQCLILGT